MNRIHVAVNFITQMLVSIRLQRMNMKRSDVHYQIAPY
jgi:hypothetical protein